MPVSGSVSGISSLYSDFAAGGPVFRNMLDVALVFKDPPQEATTSNTVLDDSFQLKLLFNTPEVQTEISGNPQYAPLRQFMDRHLELSEDFAQTISRHPDLAPYLWEQMMEERQAFLDTYGYDESDVDITPSHLGELVAAAFKRPDTIAHFRQYDDVAQAMDNMARFMREIDRDMLSGQVKRLKEQFPAAKLVEPAPMTP